jgi:GDP-L-fucose synthase
VAHPAISRRCTRRSCCLCRRGDTWRTPSIECWGDGSASREFLYVADAAEGILLAAEQYDGDAPVNLGAGMEKQALFLPL